MGMSIANIVAECIQSQGLTLREFAEALSVKHNGSSPMTHVTIINWRDGKTEPGTDLLISLLMAYRDWRHDFALKCLEVRRPEVWGENGGMWAYVEDHAQTGGKS